ncbi:hypothetical protein SLE2022_264550 [Rubroshorea leprosula]
MGKRKRSAEAPNTQKDITTNNNNDTNLDSTSSPEEMPCSSGTELLSKENSSNLLDVGMGIGDGPVKLLNAPSSSVHHQYNHGRSIFLKRSRHYYGHQYSRRNSSGHGNPSTSHGKSTPSHDERLAFKLASQYNAETGRHSDGREKAFNRPERIRSSSLAMDAVSSDAVKIVCGLCQKVLRRKPYFIGNTMASSEFSVVAVLVCGHVYHADCLEQKTSAEDRRDPSCPLCSGSVSQV